MALIPALSKTWSSRMNVPFGSNNTTTALITQFAAWSLKQHLINAHTADGTLYGTRAANSVWTVVGSSDGSTAGMDGTDRWTTTFTASKIVRASTGSAHSWIVLQNSTSGYQMCIDMNSTSSGGNCNIIFARSSGGFTGGNTTTRPTASANEEFNTMDRNAPTTSSSFFYLSSDTTTNGVYYTHFSCADDATFHFSVSRATTNKFSSFLAFARTSGANGSDSRNWYALGDSASSDVVGRGVPRANSLSNSSSNPFSSTRMHNGALPSSGGTRCAVYGNTVISSSPSFGIDAISNSYLVDPITFREYNATTGLVLNRGFLPDFYVIGSIPAVGSTYPSSNQTHFVMGDFLVPCANGANPII